MLVGSIAAISPSGLPTAGPGSPWIDGLAARQTVLATVIGATSRASPGRPWRAARHRGPLPSRP
jgi:hypothetical protein